MTEIRKSVLRTVRLDDDVWAAVKGMDCSLNQYLRSALLDIGMTDYTAEREQHPISIQPAAESFEPLRDNRPKNAYCKHCGSRFAGAKFATICPECKSSGHTLTPAECPTCNEARAI